MSIQGPGKPLLALAAFVGTLKSGDGATWVPADVAAGAERASRDRQDRRAHLQFIDLNPDGPRGYAYSDGKTVVVAYIRPPLGPPSHPLTPLEVGTVFTRIIETTPPPVPQEKTENSVLERFPLARGNFISPTDPGWVYFRTDEKGSVPTFCRVSPDGGTVGFDIGFTTVR